MSNRICWVRLNPPEGRHSVVNENDSVCIEEIENEHKIFGDNDTLSAIVAVLVSADACTDVGYRRLYDGDPRKTITHGSSLSSMRSMMQQRAAGGAGATSERAVYTKLAAAAIAMETVLTW